MPSLENQRDLSVRRWAQIIWPGFLAACLLEALVFTMVDPGEVHWPGDISQPSRQAVYSVGFACFWIISNACCWMALWLNDGNAHGEANVTHRD